MQTAMQNHFSPADQAAQIIAMPAQRGIKAEPLPFRDSNDHLQALEYEAKLMVAAAALRIGAKPEEDGPESAGRFPFLPAGAGLQETAALYRAAAAENRTREAVSIQCGIPLTYLDFCETWKLDPTERKIVLLLLMQFTSPGFLAAYQASGLERKRDNGMEIGALLTVISENLSEQLENRRCFTIHGTLLGMDLLTANHDFVDSTTSVLRMSVYLHERFVRYILGDENQYHVAFRFIRQERSCVKLDQVVLGDGLKRDVVRNAERYLASRRDGSFERMDSFFSYGTGLTFLFHGPSGTGKTMLAKGLANHLDCPLVSLNLEDMARIPVSDDDILAMLFREAALLNGIVFLDECDDVFGRENTRLSRALLLEIEKSRCITILATNKPLELDPAMERRITMKVKFELPEAGLREQMWQALIPPTAQLADDIDLKALAGRFPFTGGLIKNSILMAMTSALPAGDAPVVLTQEALEHAAAFQTATISDLSRICEKITPAVSLDAVPVGSSQREQLRGLARAWDWLRREETGFNLLFNCSDIATGIKAASGLAAEAGLTVSAYDITRVSSLAEDDKIMDMVTQRRIYPMTAAFQNASSGRSMTLFIDYLGDVSRLIDSGYEKATNIMYSEMFHQLRRNRGLFCLVTKDLKTGNIPIEFHQLIALAYPSEEVQMQQWERNLGAGRLSDDQLVELVERFPMHIAEIEFIARQVRVRSIVSGRPVPEMEDVTHVITGYRGSRGKTVLFGGRP